MKARGFLKTTWHCWWRRRTDVRASLAFGVFLFNTRYVKLGWCWKSTLGAWGWLRKSYSMCIWGAIEILLLELGSLQVTQACRCSQRRHSCGYPGHFPPERDSYIIIPLWLRFMSRHTFPQAYLFLLILDIAR